MVAGFYALYFSGESFVFFQFILEGMFGGSGAKNKDFIGVGEVFDDLSRKSLHLIVATFLMAVLIGDGQVLGTFASMIVGFYFRSEVLFNADFSHLVGFEEKGLGVIDPNSVIRVHGEGG